MASAAAVGVDLGRSPIRNDIGEDRGLPGEITSAIGSKETAGLDTIDNEDEQEDDVRSTARRRGVADAAMFGEDGGSGADAEPSSKVADDLFGDDEDEEAPPQRLLDDEELDSGDDLERQDRVDEEVGAAEQQYETQEKTTMDIEMARQPLPEPSDGEMYLMKVPDFMTIEPSAWDHTNFQPPTTDHHSNQTPSSTFSAFNTAMSTIRWRHSPKDPSVLQSNARMLRWSDGSLTLQMASAPTIHYEIDGNPLAPPQRNPIKPTPVSIKTNNSKAGRQGDGTIVGEKYDQNKDAFTYMMLPSEATASLRVAHKITAGLSIRQSESITDEAIERLEAALAIAANATKVNGTNDLKLIDEDPEARRKKAEEDMRQIEKANKRREAAVQRENDRTNRVMGRHGGSGGRSGGGNLNASMLEDDEGGAGGRAKSRKSGGGQRRQQRPRRNSIYSEDEDFGRKRFATKEDEYDEEDDFVAPSDEEDAGEEEDDEDPDDGIVEESREKSDKRARPTAPAAPAGGDEDADGEPDDEVQQARVKRRRVIDEDDDEE